MSHYEATVDCTDYECLVCSELSLNTKSCTECSILICDNCQAAVNVCPQCRCDTFTSNAFVVKFTKKIKVICTLCPWTGDFADFSTVRDMIPLDSRPLNLPEAF
eukprot:sb/3478092/